MKIEKMESDMFDSMWNFMQMGQIKSNYPALKEACMELRQMMMQKTAGQRKDKKSDLSFDNLPRVKNTIIIEAMALVLSGDLEPRGHAHWEMHGGDIICSECGTCSADFTGDYIPKYCQECGRVMDEEEVE